MAGHHRAVFRRPEDLRVHRQLLYRAAAPVFRLRGYREATLKELAATCGLSIPALYRYFSSKRDFALYPLSAANRPTSHCFSDAADDPFVHLQLWLDHAAGERDDFLLAMRLGGELRENGGLSDEHFETFEFHIDLLAALLRATAPGLRDQHARELVESLLAMSFGADAIGVRWSQTTARTRFMQLLTRDLVRTGADRARLAEMLLSEAGHPEHGPCSLQVAPTGAFFDKGPSGLTPNPART